MLRARPCGSGLPSSLRSCACRPWPATTRVKSRADSVPVHLYEILPAGQLPMGNGEEPAGAPRARRFSIAAGTGATTNAPADAAASAAAAATGAAADAGADQRSAAAAPTSSAADTAANATANARASDNAVAVALSNAGRPWTVCRRQRGTGRWGRPGCGRRCGQWSWRCWGRRWKRRRSRLQRQVGVCVTGPGHTRTTNSCPAGF
jgi:hypothetical protein